MTMAQTRSSYQSPFGPNKEMGYTRQEFMRLLPRCLSDYEYSISDEVVTIALTSGRIEIHIGDEGERVYTPLVKFPTLPVELPRQWVKTARKHF